MTYRVFFTLPVLVLGLACRTSQSTGTASTAKPNEPSAGASASANTPAGSATAGGSTEAGAATAELKGHADDRIISGRVASASGDMLTINSDDGSQQTLSVVDQTTVMVNGQQASLSDLQPGQDVRASYNEQDGKHVAVKVESGPGGSLGAGGSMSYPPGTKPDSGSANDAGQGGAAGTAAPGSSPGSSATPDKGSTGSSTGSKW